MQRLAFIAALVVPAAAGAQGLRGKYGLSESGLPLSGGALVGALPTCTGDAVSYDNNGVAGCQRTVDTAPQGLLVRPQTAYPAGTQTASNLILAGGQDETKIAIDGADPTVTCAGNNDTVTITVVDSNGASTATVLTGDTNWTVAASVATTCANLATAVEALAGVGATCTSPNVLMTLDQGTTLVTLAESTAACTTVATGTPGAIIVRSRITNDTTYAQFGASGGTPNAATGANDLYMSSGTDFENDGTTRFDGATSVNALMSVNSSGIKLLDDVAVQFGSGTDAYIQYNTGLTPDGLQLALGLDSRVFSIIEAGDQGTDFAKGLQTNPTVCVQSADQTTVTDRICIAHDQTDAVLSSDGGNIKIVPASSITAVTGILAASGAPRDVGTTCTAGEVMIDTGGATVEICVCTATDTIRCVATATTNPVN